MKDIRERAVRGGLAKICSQGVNFVVRIGSLMLLSRLLSPWDFGLVGMVTAFTGVLILFRDFGLSAATIQSTTITEEQVSSLFWVNLSVGATLTAVILALSQAIARFYHEPRLWAVGSVLSMGFVFNAAGVQHSASLQRQMRFVTLAMIDMFSMLVATAVGIVAALRGYGYWSLVSTATVTPLLYTICVWGAAGWLPKLPRKSAGIGSLMRFGGTVTLNSLLGYTATNFEKILLGRYWGADVIGIYGRAYQLITIPTDNLNATAGEVAFAALSRLQNDPQRFRSYFLKGYSLIITLTLPATMACAVFAPDMVQALLGKKWTDAIPIFRLLAPTVLVFGIVNPLGWLLTSLGRLRRFLNMSLVITPVMILGYLIAVPHGPERVAAVYSVLMSLWVLPAIAWALKDTPVSFTDMLSAMKSPLVSGVTAAVVAYGVRTLVVETVPTLPRFILEGIVMLLVYATMLLFVSGQKSLYLDMFRALRGGRPRVDDEPLARAESN